MLAHLSEETLMDVVDGTASPAAREHVASCESCRTRVADAAEAWGRARRRIAAKFTLSHMQRATLSVYDELLSSRLAARFDERPALRAPSST